MTDAKRAVTFEPTEATERVGRIEMRVKVGDMNAEAVERWDRRAEILAQWLVAAWRREQAEGDGSSPMRKTPCPCTTEGRRQ